MIYALINIATGIVENIAVFDEAPFTPDEGFEFVPGDNARIGDRFENGAFVREEDLPIVSVMQASVSDRQFFQGLAMRGEITEAEALDAVGPGIIPAAMLLLIGTLPEEERFGASMLIRGATVFERGHPLAAVIGQLYGWDDGEIDGFWSFAATL